MAAYLGVLVYILIAVGLGMVILSLAFLVSPRRIDLEKNTAYECGFDPFGQARSPFDIGFYLVAILFLVFDIEVAYLFPWALGGALTGWSGLGALMLFLGVLILGFVYEWQKGALDWNSSGLNHHQNQMNGNHVGITALLSLQQRFHLNHSTFFNP